MRHLLEDITSSISGGEESAENEDGPTAEEKTQLRERLRQQLNVILETRETARGLIVNISDVLFDFDKDNIKPSVDLNLKQAAAVISAIPKRRKVYFNGYTDSKGSDAYNKDPSQRRAIKVSQWFEDGKL